MNMYGIMTPVESGAETRHDRLLDRARHWLWQRRMFLLVVVAPMLLLSAYLYLISSDQYESEAHYLVRSENVGDSPQAGVGQVLSFVTGGASNSQSEAMSVADYLTSHDAVSTLSTHDNLVGRFHRPDVDFFSRLRKANPAPEQLLKYYRKQVLVKFNTETGITTLRVHSFRPEDSYQLVQRLLALGEQRVNVLNARSYHDAIATARQQLSAAENDLVAGQKQLTRYRQNRGDIDPQASGQAQITLVTSLSGQLSAARAQLIAMGNMISHASPQYKAVAGRVAALEGQLAAQSAKLTGGSQTIAGRIGDYQDLQLRQQFLAKRYEAAAVAVEKAREQAIRQQLYLVRVVEPNMPVKALYPERGRILLTVLIALLLAYAIGWLIVAGVREHAA